MKKYLIPLLIVLVLLSAIAFIRMDRSTRSTLPIKIDSPNGEKILVANVNNDKQDVQNYLLVFLEVQDARSGKIIFQVQTNASHRMRWEVSWVDDQTIKLDSADIGTYCWKEESDQLWAEYLCP